jgi:hypothetical protein
VEGPTGRPRRARFPKLQDCFAGLSVADVGIRGAGFPGLVGYVNQPGRVMRKPPREGVVRASIPELGKDSLAKSDDGVSLL